MAALDYLGSNQFFQDRGFELGKKSQRDQDVNGFLKILIEEGYSEKEALDKINSGLPELED